jgi:hypothetical protein
MNDLIIENLQRLYDLIGSMQNTIYKLKARVKILEDENILQQKQLNEAYKQLLVNNKEL